VRTTPATGGGGADPAWVLLWVTGGAGALIVLLALLRAGRGDSRRRRDRGELAKLGAGTR